MSKNQLSPKRVHSILTTAREASILVLGDVMLDQFIWGNVSRISPEAPVPVVDFARESFMPGGAANVARNLSALGVRAELFGIVGQDHAANHQTLRRNTSCLSRINHQYVPTTCSRHCPCTRAAAYTDNWTIRG